MYSRLIKKQLWTLAEGKAIGYIESISKKGLIFKHDCIAFRETSSNLSTGNIFDISLEKSNIEKNWLEEIMKNKISVCIDFNTQLFSFPTFGNIIKQDYVTNITILRDEVITISKTENKKDYSHQNLKCE